MGALRDLAQRALREVEHPLEHGVERLEQPHEPFQEQSTEHGVVEHHPQQKTAKKRACSTVPAFIAWNGGTPAEVAEKLSRMPCPPRVDPHCWRQVVVDCQRLVAEGWAEKALGLGWTALDLFGAVTDPAGDPEAEGLAVKLAGRKVLAICASFATVENGPNARAFIYRGTNEGARLLWALSRAR